MESTFSDIWSLDAHCDTWYMREFLKGARLPPELASFDPDTFFRITPSRLKEGNVRCLFVNAGDIGFLTSSAIIDNLHLWAEEEGDTVSICLHASDVYQAAQSGKLAVILACESSYLCLHHLSVLRNLHRLGVRMMSVTHGEGQEGLGWFGETALRIDSLIQAYPSFASQITPSRDEYMDTVLREDLRKKERGLTDFGKSLVTEMIRLGIICDLSHANDATFFETLAIAREEGSGKICCSHSNCAALCNHTRNCTDDMMEELADCNGVMGICFFGEFIDEHTPSLARYVDHILHALDLMGPDHVGIGSDYDGVPPGSFMAVPHPGQMNILWMALSEAGVSMATMQKIAHKNFLRLL